MIRPINGYAFILNLLDYHGPLPLEILPNISFALADNFQKTEIINFLKTNGSLGGLGGPNLYCNRPELKRPKGAWNLQKLPPSEIKFWVLNCDDINQLNSVEIPFLLTNASIEWGATFYKGGRGFQLLKTFHFFQSHLYPIMSPLSDLELLEVRDLHELTQSLKGSLTESNKSVIRVLRDYSSSRSYVRVGHQALLNHFSLIEALITHEPKATAGDSLNHQISTKMALLSRRFNEPLDASSFFKISDVQKIWKLLYDVRSTFAHGSELDLKKGPLAPLGDFEHIEQFVHLSLKKLFKLALKEPDFIFDLKRC